MFTDDKWHLSVMNEEGGELWRCAEGGPVIITMHA